MQWIVKVVCIGIQQAVITDNDIINLYYYGKLLKFDLGSDSNRLNFHCLLMLVALGVVEVYSTMPNYSVIIE